MFFLKIENKGVMQIFLGTKLGTEHFYTRYGVPRGDPVNGLVI